VTVSSTYKDAPTEMVDVGGAKFAYRQLGADTGVPVIFLNHLGGVLDNWDPRVVDGIAARHRVITFDNRGVGASDGSTPDSVAAMAQDAVALIRALGFDQVDLLGFSLGGFITQVIAQQEPQLVRKIVLAGTGPAGGEGIDKVTSVTIRDMIKGALTFKDPKYYLFFTRTANGRTAARQFLERLKERTDNRDRSISLTAFRRQLKAIHAWGGTVASERTASSRSGKVEALSSNRAARIAQSDQSRVSTVAFRARVEDVEGGDRQMQQCPLVHPEGVTGRP
jgi:pimeloyl-ACP methyl ester carboxylesterase